jgi:PAS domain S-box-containing protein
MFQFISGYKEEEIFGKNLSILLPKGLDEVHHLYLQAYLKKKNVSDQNDILYK